MKLENIRANSGYILMEVVDGGGNSSSGFSIVDDGALSVGKVLHAGVKTGLEEFSVKKIKIDVFFETSAAVDFGFGFSNVKIIHVDNVLAYSVDLSETDE